MDLLGKDTGVKLEENKKVKQILFLFGERVASSENASYMWLNFPPE